MMHLQIKSNIVLIGFLFLPCLLFSQDKARKYLVEGNKNYLIQSYDEAAANYLRAIQEGEDTYKSNFNLGNAMFRQKKYDDAIFQYGKSAKFASGKIEESQAYFNQGDGYYKKREYAKAAEAFKKALKLNPKDEKARYNYALTKQKLKEQEEKQQKEREQSPKDKQENQKETRKQDPQNQQDNSSQNPQDNKESQQGQSGGQGNNQSGQGSGNEQGREGIQNSRSYEENNSQLQSGQKQYYEGILGAMKEQERRAQQKIINKKIPPSGNSGGKDW